MNTQIESLLLFWAKTTHDAESYPRAYHPLLCHMIDVAVVTNELWHYTLAPTWCERVCDELGLGAEETARVVAWLAGLHDLGKASPPFALRTDSQSARVLREMFCGTDYDAPLVPPAKDAPHGTVTTHALGKILHEEYGVAQMLAKRLAVLLGGHHGVFPLRNYIDAIAAPQLGGKSAWMNARRDLTFALGEQFGIPRPLASLKARDLSDATTMLIAGLVSVADWIGSDTRFFECAIRDARAASTIDFESYFAQAQEQAKKALRQLGWMAAPRTTASAKVDFAQMFPHIKGEPRPLQTTALEIADKLDAPGIAIIEAPTGEGKTEAAMTLADAWARVTGGRGYYFALPTQATSNGMFSRVREFLRARYGDEEGVTLQLIHGHAALSAEFSEMLKAGKSALTPQDVYDDGARDARPHSASKADGRVHGCVIAAEWFTYRKRGLLAAFGVGTIDQALLAALQTPHVFVRLFGLAGKVVIVDEVHAYDAYMTTLLERLLEWLAALRSPVILLSATLPRQRSEALLNAYLKGGAQPLAGDDDVYNTATKKNAANNVTLASYPRITWATTGRDDATKSAIISRPLETSDEAKRTLHLRVVTKLVNSSEGDFRASIGRLAVELQQALVHGGCAAVICNTVRRAQDIYRELQTFFHGKAFVDEENDALLLDLLHARFIYDERMKRERSALQNFGKEEAEIIYDDGTRGKVKRPARAILVATQIIEQSLDLDFDLMITELAPVDLLLQRAGRLHRHRARQRPQGLEEPTLWIVEPNMMPDGAPDFDRSKYVYDEHVLLRSWLEIRNKLNAHGASIDIPAEVETLIENVYDDARLCLDENLARVWTATRAEREQRLADERREAQDRWLARPNADVPLWRFTSHPREEDEPEFHPAHQALTRLTEPSVQVACLYGADAANASLDPHQRERVNLNEPPPLAEAKKILFRSITISGYRAALPLMKTEVPRGWQKSALLRHHRVLLFNAKNEAKVGKNVYLLDAQLGLLINNAQKGHEENA